MRIEKVRKTNNEVDNFLSYKDKTDSYSNYDR